MTDINYPDSLDLERISRWNPRDGRGLLEYVRRRWSTSYGKWEGDPATGSVFAVSTGGWSGNEELIEALERNAAFWSIVWQSSIRGGHYALKLPESMYPVQETTTPDEAAKITQGPTMLRALDPRMLRWFAMLVDTGAEAVASRICGDMSLEAAEMWTDAEQLQIATMYEQHNSGGEQEPWFGGQAWPYLYWLSHHLRTWSEAGKALVPVDAGPEHVSLPEVIQ